LPAKVIDYSSCAGFFPWQYHGIHFFLALNKGQQVEKDNKLHKLDMFFFLYGINLAQIPQFHELPCEFIFCTGWDMRMSPEGCEEVIG
ncbi:Speedy protein B, partial [Heterocephalus glaber]